MELKENEYLVNLRLPNSFEYKPVLKTDRKSRVAKYINRLYDTCEELRFRIDTLEKGSTFVNSREQIDYFLNKRERIYKKVK